MFGKKKDLKIDVLSDAVVVIDDTVDPHVVLYHQPRSYPAEQYRVLRTNIEALNRDKLPRALTVTSATKGEGKSLSTLNLGIAFAELDHVRACVVDCDWRNPDIHEMLSIESRPGLSEVLQDQASLDDAVRATRVRDLFVIPAGAEPRNPSDLLASERVDNLIEHLKERYHYILFDTPPVTAFTDATNLAPRTDGVILVVRLEQTPRKLVEDSLGALQSVGSAVLGVFLNGARPPGSREPARYYYKY